MGTFWQDFRFSLRMLLKKPAFTIIAVITLGLGIGANTAIFSVVYSLLFRPLPVQNPEQLVSLSATRFGTLPMALSYPDLESYQELKEVFSDVAGHSLNHGQLRGDSDTVERIFYAPVTDNYFTMLGLEAARGRVFVPRRPDQKAAGPIAVLSHKYWQRRFDGDPATVGRTVEINGFPTTIIGVTPANFKGSNILVPDLFVPVSTMEILDPNFDEQLDDRLSIAFRVIARLQPDVSLEEAQAAVTVHSARLAEEYPDSNEGKKTLIHPEPMARMEPGAAVYLPPIAAVFMILVSLVLLIACANVTNLILGRSIGRQKELALRSALGAGRVRIARQLLTENVMLAILGAGAGLLVAKWATGVISSVRIASEIPFEFDFSLNPKIFLYALALAIITGLLTGMMPALQATKANLSETLKEGGRTSGGGGGRHRLRNLLVITQVAISLVLLISAGLFVRSMGNVSQMDLGFLTANRLLMSTDTDLQNFDESQTRIFYRELLQRVRSLPGVEAATTATFVPIDVRNNGARVFIEGQTTQKEQENRMFLFNAVNSDYFRVMGTPILRGRGFTDDDADSQRKVVIVNERLVELYWPDDNPIGKRLSTESSDGPWLEVVGVAKQGKYNLPGESRMGYLYLPIAQDDYSFQVLHIHTRGEPLEMVPSVRAEIQSLDPNMAIFDIKTMETHIREGKGALLFQMGSGLVGSFGLIGLILAAIGLYGVIAHSVSQRTREIGVRIALGASLKRILKTVIGQGFLLTCIGLALGFLGAFGLTRFFANLLVGITPTDPVTFAAVALMLVAVALLACYIPARRATRVSPIEALRYE